MKILDCTLRDGGYHNAWDFQSELVKAYLEAMKAARVDVVELGFRFLSNSGFKGACAYTTDDYVRSLPIPANLSVSVMVNGADLCTNIGREKALAQLFPVSAHESPVDLVRFACHLHEVDEVLPAAEWLRERGYQVGLNLMQIADRTQTEVAALGQKAKEWPIKVLYFADSMGGMTPDDVARVIQWLREEWTGEIGIHTHDNMGLALVNTLRAYAEGVTWLDATVTGMGRGPGNARTEELVIEAEDRRNQNPNLVPLLTLIREYFRPLKEYYGWGTNPYYYLSGKYGIHPTYIQEMLSDARYDEEDIFAVIDHLRIEGGKKFSFNTLDGARQFYRGEPRGKWSPASIMKGREVLILGSGPGVERHRCALESYIHRASPLVVALNTQSEIQPELIDTRIACHPVRLLADAATHVELPQPLITPASMLPESLEQELHDKEVLDFGLGVDYDRFAFYENHCIVPTSLVFAYALAVVASGGASRILMAGFDGYPAGDVRNEEIDRMLMAFSAAHNVQNYFAVTPTTYKRLPGISIYGM